MSNRFVRARRIGIAGLVVASTIALSACGGNGDSGGDSADTADEASELHMLASLPLSGPIAANGDGARVGLEAAVQVINEEGGIMGREVVLEVVDNALDPTQVAGRIQEAFASENVPELVYAGFTTPEAQAGLSLTNQSNVLAITTAAGDNLEDFDRFFAATPQNIDAQRATLAAVEESGAESFGVIVADNESGTAAIETFSMLAEEFDLEMTGSELIAADAIDATAQLQRLEGGNPDTLVASMSIPVIAVVLESRAKLGWNVPTFSDHNAAYIPVWDMLSESALEGYQVVAPALYIEGSDVASSGALSRAFSTIEEINGGSFETLVNGAIYAYLSVILAKYAIEEAGTTDAASVWEARTTLELEEMPLYSGSGALYDRDNAWAWPEFVVDDFLTVAPGGLADGFLIDNN